MHPIADEKRDHDNIPDLRHAVTITDARVFFDENGMHLGIFVPMPNEFDLSLDGFAGVFILSRAVAGDEKSDFGGLGRLRKWMLRNNIPGTGQQDARHAFVGANGRAIIERLLSPLLHARESLIVCAKAQLKWDGFLGKITFTDKERHDEDAACGHIPQRIRDSRFDLPKALHNPVKDLAAAQFAGVLKNGRARLLILGRAVPDQEQGGIRKIIVHDILSLPVQV
jgi:hypothetical protein